MWDVASPVVVNRSFTVHVGTKCAAACRLTGQLIVVRDEAGIQVGKGKLGDTPWPGTSALYAAEVNLVAPAREGMYTWSVTSAGAESAPHEDAVGTFSFLTAGPPDHRLTVTVLDEDTAAPVENVQVRLGVYRASTDVRGCASLELPKGRYDLQLWKVGYETPSKTVELTESVAIQVKAVFTPDNDPDDEQVWM